MRPLLLVPLLAVLAVLPLLLLAATPAAATSFTVSASHTGAQETPPVDSSGTGSLTGMYDDVTNLLTWSGSFMDLTGTTLDAHFHGPAEVGMGPAPITVPTNVGSGDVFPLNVTSGDFSGEATITDADEADLKAGLWYHNIHTTFAALGEIRGQVSLTPLPEPGVAALFAAGAIGLALWRRPV